MSLERFELEGVVYKLGCGEIGVIRILELIILSPLHEHHPLSREHSASVLELLKYCAIEDYVLLSGRGRVSWCY